ncbi:13809_t:CDS:2, partial [Entrophospora sp. SA101]
MKQQIDETNKENNADLEKRKRRKNEELEFKLKTKGTSEYIKIDLAQQVLSSPSVVPLKEYKWFGTMLTSLQINVVNSNDISCSKLLPSSIVSSIQNQLEDDNMNIVYFDDKREHGVKKLTTGINENVLSYLENFESCYTLDQLKEALNKNNIHGQTNVPFDIKYIYQFSITCLNLTEFEYSAYVWVPLINYAFMESDNIKIASGDVSSRGFEKLKSLAQTQNKTGPRIDTKGAILSTGIEVLLIENAVNEDQNKQLLDQEKLDIAQ